MNSFASFASFKFSKIRISFVIEFVCMDQPAQLQRLARKSNSNSCVQNNLPVCVRGLCTFEVANLS